MSIYICTVNPLGHWFWVPLGTGFRIPLKRLSGFWVTPLLVVQANIYSKFIIECSSMVMARCHTQHHKLSINPITRYSHLVFMLMPASNGGKSREQKTWIGFKHFFVDEYHDLNITHNMSAGQMGYHSVNDVVPTGDITSALDNLEMYATAEQSHVDHDMATIFQLTETNKILGDQIKQLSETNAILDRQGQEDKNATNKMIVTLQNWIQPYIVGLMGGRSPRGTTIDLAK